jgi:hypothetical protein
MTSDIVHKKHKEKKKNKKERKEKKDKERHHVSSNGGVISSSKKHKHHKNKEREREASAAASMTPNSITKLKIKPMQPQQNSSVGGEPPPVPTMKISLNSSNPMAASISSKKRPRQHSDSSDSSLGSMGSSAPALKMSRVIGTSAEQESTFLNHHHLAKPSRKVCYFERSDLGITKKYR